MIVSCSYTGTEMEKEQTMQQILEMQEKADTDRIGDREYMKQMMVKMESWGGKIWAEMEAIRAETKAIHEKMMAKLDAHYERAMAHQEVTEAEPNPGLMQSIEEHQEIPKGE
jgi:hypothetical protein